MTRPRFGSAACCAMPWNVQVEPLEGRQLLCAAHADNGGFDSVELRPDLVGVNPPTESSGPPADIVWTNRGSAANDSDGFNAVFGTTGAAVARAVIDAVIVSYERMIGSFNYADGTSQYFLQLSMDNVGMGAWAGMLSTLGGKPKSGIIGMGSGTDQHGNGWFIDPTPFDNSEFTGNITNAYSGDAPSGSPASGKGDFLTVAAAEITHCMGLYGGDNTVPTWDALSFNTGIPDTAEGGGMGHFWVFNGPSIRHLMTGNNGGPGGNSFPGAVHGAGPNVPVVYNGETYIGAQDQGNALYEFSRRYLVNNTFSLMFKDAFGYSTVDPARFGTFYSVRNETNNSVLVRGGRDNIALSDDTLTISRSGSTIFVSVDVGQDVPGTGALPGHGNLPAFVTQYDISEVSTITISAGAGNDTINIGAGIGVPISIDGGDGIDTLAVTGSISADTITVNGSGITGPFSISLAGGGNGAIENLVVNGDFGNDTINFDAAGAPFNGTVNGGAGNDTLNVSNANGTTSPVFNAGTGTTNTLNLNSGSYLVSADLGAGASVVAVNVNSGSLTFSTSQHLAALSIASSGTAALAAGGNRVLAMKSLSINGSGTLDLFDNDLLVDYTGATPLSAVRAMIASGRDFGSWNGNGITSTSARLATNQNTTLGVMEGLEYSTMLGTSMFSGETIDTTVVLVKHTYYGDTDFNGVIDFDDYARTDFGFNTVASGWANGDFDLNGVIEFDDYVLLDLGFNTQNGAL